LLASTDAMAADATAARIMSQASSGEVLVSESVRLSMLGDGAFEPATVVELKGLPGRWSLHRAP
jgi:class 3 adenylate cyclase